MRFLAIISYTLRESLAKKTFMAFFIVITIIHLLFIFALNVDLVSGGMAAVQLFGKDVEQEIDVAKLQKIIIQIESVLAMMMYGAGIFFAVFATASLVPNMLEKGSVDLLLSRPFARWQLLLGRFLGALSIVAINVAYLIGGAWFILSAKTGFWYTPFLLSGIVIVLTFGVLYAIMTFVGVTVRNSGVAIMAAYLVMMILSPLLLQREKIYALLSHKIYQSLLDGLYYLTPRTTEMGNLTRALVAGEPISSWAPLFHSLGVGAAFLLGAIHVFQKKDF
ncbi:MAG: ABC transporter permease [candidate division KSB1 bacterium]|nr:ABC transporter permease [candidate division KSB1 bacterium]MDZ7301892.1 ABC transporter permease [candidate division KSB1 bacterium]MDZ7310275.1 ABC transporter permease [candidate division KSB1 bacterium]